MKNVLTSDLPERVELARIIYGHRIGSDAPLRPSVSAIVFDEIRRKVLLTRRTDNGLWCLPGGGIDSGESAAEACEREVLEETGLVVQVIKLVGVYSSPDVIIEYADGNRYQPLVISFETTVLGGELQLSTETTGFGYFAADALDQLDLMEQTQQRIDDALIGAEAAFIR